MAREENDLDFGAFVLGAIVGGLVGAAVGLLFAPQSGEETRGLLRDKGIELRDRMNETAEAARARAEAMARDAKARAEELQRKGQVVLEEQKARLDAAVVAGKRAAQSKRVELDQS